MEKKTEGSWIIHHTQKLTRFDNVNGYDNLFAAGKSGLLLSAISATNQHKISIQRVKALAQASKITTLELPGLLDILEKKVLIERSSSGEEIEILGLTTHSALEHTSDIFNNAGASHAELASIIAAEKTSESPQKQSTIIEEIGDELQIDKKSLQSHLTDYSNIGFVDREEVSKNEDLYFNGNLFRRGETQKITKVLDSLKPEEQTRVLSFNSELKESTCIPLDEARLRLGKHLFEKVASVGLYDINIVANDQENVGFVTLPSAFSKFSNSMVDDAFDLAKAFVSSITYGMTRSSWERGNIQVVDALLSTLIRGEPVGPVQAINQDYRVLELKGVVRVYHGSKNGRTGPMLKLLKKEIGELALSAIRQGDISEHSVPNLPGAAIYRYQGPEENRERARKKDRAQSTRETADILMTLRTGS